MVIELVYCLRNYFTENVIPDLIRNPLPTGRQESFQMDSRSPPPRGQVYPCESRGGNDNPHYHCKEVLDSLH